MENHPLPPDPSAPLQPPPSQDRSAHPRFHYAQMTPKQKRGMWAAVLGIALLSALYIGAVCHTMIREKSEMHDAWDYRLSMDEVILTDEQIRATGATVVHCGTYVDFFKSLSPKDSSFRADLLVWFLWDGPPELDMKNHFRFYSGTIHSMQVVLDEQRPDGSTYQLVRVDVTVYHDFATTRFPLDSHQLEFYLEANYPIETVCLDADQKNSSVNEYLELSGYRVLDSSVRDFYFMYNSTYLYPDADQRVMTSEVITTLTITRDGFGMYLKCVIALLGATAWIFLTLFICTYHRVDPLSLIPSALFGVVGNIMVGANVLPESLSLGLLEYINQWGVLSILGVSVAIISLNRIYAKGYNDAYAHYLGRILFWLLLVSVTAGHVLMPVSAYLW